MTPSKDVSRRRWALSLRTNDDPDLVVHIVYALFALSLVTAFPAVIGIIIALIGYQQIDDEVLLSHYRYQIRSFLIMVVVTVIGSVLVWLFVGLIILGLCWLWFLYRVVKGWLKLTKGEAMKIGRASCRERV